MKTIIYTLSDPRTGQVRYVGKTTKSLKERLRLHFTDSRMNKRTCWLKNLRKEGLIPIMEVLEECTFIESGVLEQYWISQFKTWGFKLCNGTEGGEGTIGIRYSQEFKDAISLRMKGRYIGDKNPFYGKKHTDETKRAISITNSGRIRSQEFKNAARSRQKLWKPSTQMIEKMILSHGRKVKQLDMNGNIINIFNTIIEAANTLNLKQYHIVRCCKGERNTHGGYRWEYSPQKDTYV